MVEATIKSMAAELAKGLKIPEDLNQMTAVFKKFMIETAINTELSDHLGYVKHQPKKGSNTRNGLVLKQFQLGVVQNLVISVSQHFFGRFAPKLRLSLF